MEQLDSISMTLLDCVLRQAEKDLQGAKGQGPKDTAADSSAQRKIDSLLRKMAAREAKSMIDKQRGRQGPGRKAA